nr:hypothetical protein [Tanacetum cinerariifolium]
EQLLFLAGGSDNAFDDDVDEQPVQDLALNMDNVFQAKDCDAFDSDVDEAPTAQTMFMANLSSADPITDEAEPSYNSNILSEAQPALYNGHEILKDNHAPTKVYNAEDTLEIAEITRKKMNAKMTNPECVTHKVKIAPHDYTKDNLLATFTPQKQLTPEQIYWSNDLMKFKSEALKERAKVSRPIKAFTVKHDAIDLKNLLIANDNLIAECLSKEVFSAATKSELNIARFAEMYVANTSVEAHCLALEAELATLHDKNHQENQGELIKHFSKLKVDHLNLQLNYQNLKDSIGNNPPTPDKDTPDFDSVFVISKMQASLQGKDNAIRQLKKQLSQLQVTRSDTDRTLRVQTTDSQITKLTDHVTHLQAQNDLFRAENDKIKQHYKELYDSIKITRAKHIEQEPLAEGTKGAPHLDAKDIWDNVKMLLEGSKLTKEDRESQLYNDFENFRQYKGEIIHDYYVQFAKLINDMRNIKMTMSIMQLNSKFVNIMLPEWGRFVIVVKLNRGLMDSNYDQLNQATIQDGRVVVQNVQGRQDRGQGMNPRGGGAAGYGGVQNGVGNVNPGQARQVKCYNCNGTGNIASNCTQPKHPQNSEYYKDKMLLMQAQENGDFALNVDNVFYANDCDAFDSDVDEAPTAQTMFMANLSSADHVTDEAGPSYDSNILSEVQDHDHYQDVVCAHHKEHAMHDSVQLNHVVDSHANYMSDSNMIPYDQYVNDNESLTHHGTPIVENALTAELATYKEQVELYERRAKFELTEREQKINEQLRIVISDRNFKEETLKKELHSIKLQLACTINHKKSMVEEVTFLKKDFKEKENKYLEEFLDMKSLKEKPALYNGHEIIKYNHVPTIVHNTEDTLEINEITRKKMNDKMKDPECVTCKVKITPHDYSKENFLATFTPQKQLTPEQISWSQDLIKLKSEALKEQTTVSRPIKALTLKHDEIERKNLLIANDNLIAECLSKEVFSVATNSELNVARLTEMHVANTIVEARCLELEAELANLHDKSHHNNQEELINRFSKLEHYKELYDFIKITRAKHIEHVTALTTKNVNLKAQILEKVNCVGKDHVKPKVLARGKYSMDVEPIIPRLKNNRDAHLDYLRHLKVSVETIRDIVDEAKVVRPLDRSIVSACRYTKHS